MSHARDLRFECLESRALLSAASHGATRAVRPTHAVAGATLQLAGTLTVDNKASTVTQDEQGDEMTSTPVSGQLGALGQVHGVWTTSTDQYGDYMGPDSLRIRGSNGSLILTFNESAGRAHHLSGGAVQYSDPQRIVDGTGAYTRAKESGTIELTSNNARTAVSTLTISSSNK